MKPMICGRLTVLSGMSCVNPLGCEKSTEGNVVPGVDF